MKLVACRSFYVFLFALLFNVESIILKSSSSQYFAMLLILKLSELCYLQGNTPLVIAGVLGHCLIAEALLGAKADVNARGQVADKLSRSRVQHITSVVEL